MKNCSCDIADWQKKMLQFQKTILGAKHFIVKQRSR